MLICRASAPDDAISLSARCATRVVIFGSAGTLGTELCIPVPTDVTLTDPDMGDVDITHRFAREMFVCGHASDYCRWA